ncbi:MULTISPECIES: NAD(P)/FAD-dependent oxidoreductase [unclassified Chelatococcus]|uniref:flavin-containing monooxygenase n=1 Tax=unclassified Chelatococcus TaxID=2638111 RepID=UPI001BCABE8C|nr:MULTISPECIES: NAD(P)/FAD-dependent oxidoreductase [unclassified Chelatococcus]MBS7701227.1 NAD(P)/FAD-dependent oxidoreductase [Chelatococcus sp. YT9]MBX3557358.1 NAD(P)/FAD-dependent oxidoreductase [Chelatococcus sp.]
MESKPAIDGAHRSEPDFDVVVVGAGIGGLYAIHKLAQLGFSVRGLEMAPEVGGVWYHNQYPGARVDVESIDYCYYFSPELFQEWNWTERYASQPEILRYLNHVADRFDLRNKIEFGTRLVSAHWHSNSWHLTAANDVRLTCRFLVMATGNLSAARKPDFPGLDDFKGEWVQSSQWPREVRLKGRRVGLVGTGSSGIQCVPAIARVADHLIVFQRTANYSVPAQNSPVDDALIARIREDVPAARAYLLSTPVGTHMKIGSHMRDGRAAKSLREAEQLAELERAWQTGGHSMTSVFCDQNVDPEANEIVSSFVRNKVREAVKDPTVAAKLMPTSYPIGTRRLCVDIDYYETYNRSNVTLVDLADEPAVCLYENGLRTTKRDYEIDLLVFALGFEAFSGQLNQIDIRNDEGARLADSWTRGPQAYLGIAVADFPNLFVLTGPGSPAVLANLFIANEHHVDWVADLMTYMARHGHRTVTATQEAQQAWREHVNDLARPLLRFNTKNYMVHVNEDDQSRYYVPYVGGFDRYVRHCDRVAARGYPGFVFDKGLASETALNASPEDPTVGFTS